jgi:ABC-type dipeptide/oligopeptide/nickel transport system permease component
MHLLPGDPTELMLAGAEGGAVSAERLDELRENMGLNDPLYQQFGNFFFGALRGDLGTSIRFRSPVTEIVLERLPFTLRLSLAGLAVAMLIGVPLGTLAAIKRNTWLDSFSMALSLIGVSMPIFWLGLLLILLFAINLRWLPTTGAGGVKALILPAFTLGFVSAALVSRLIRSSLLEVLQEDYVRTAYSKGLAGRAVLIHHAFKNALIPVVTIIGLQFGHMLAGAVVTETVFSRPGLGRLVVNAILWKDFPLVQGTVLFLAIMYVVVNLIVDISYAWLDPRIHYS